MFAELSPRNPEGVLYDDVQIPTRELSEDAPEHQPGEAEHAVCAGAVYRDGTDRAGARG